MPGKELTVAVATATLDVVGSAYGVAGIGAAVNPLVQQLLRLQDEQVKSLLRIEGGVQQLINEPWKTGRYYLEECRLPQRSPKEIRRLLRKATDKLREALGMHQPRSLAAAYVAYDLAVVFALAGDAVASKHYAEKSAEAATNATIDLIRASRARRNNLSVLDGIINEARMAINETRLVFERISEWIFGKSYPGKPKQADRLVVHPLTQLRYDDWLGIVSGASKLCKRDLVSLQYARLKPWL